MKPVFYVGGALALLGMIFVLTGVGRPDHEADAKVKERKGKQTMVRVHVFDKEGKLVGPVESPKLVLSDAEWKKRLTPDQFRILRSKGTERPFCGLLLDNKKEGVYTCAGCGLPLFSSDSKFQSGTGWPSFFRPVAEGNVAQRPDRSHGQLRTEINCARCDGHLGHVFDDGPKPTGLRFCLNSESLQFTESDKLGTIADPILEKPAADAKDSAGKEMASAIFAGGCFWCTEAAFEQLDGVVDVESGYSGGAQRTANYESVCSGQTGHAEAIRVTYDPQRISYDQLLDVFFDAHDPTQLNRQGGDIGTQYRSAIFIADEQQKKAAEAKIQQLTQADAFPRPIVTTLEPLTSFYPAEEYHQDYARNNPFQPYVVSHSIPKACKVRAKHPNLIKGNG
jgi:peptide methionine sulfoxide reductase msrA/msrB